MVYNFDVSESSSFGEMTMDQKWFDATHGELFMIEKNQTWKLVQRLHDRKVIGVEMEVKSSFFN